MQTITPVAITGNTYPVKDQLKALGARWNADAKAWMVSPEKEEQAKAIVAGAGPATPRPAIGYTSYHPTRCKVCGALAERDRRGYHIVKILKNGECLDCYEERKMGY